MSFLIGTLNIFIGGLCSIVWAIAFIVSIYMVVSRTDDDITFQLLYILCLGMIPHSITIAIGVEFLGFVGYVYAWYRCQTLGVTDWQQVEIFIEEKLKLASLSLRSRYILCLVFFVISASFISVLLQSLK